MEGYEAHVVGEWCNKLGITREPAITSRPMIVKKPMTMDILDLKEKEMLFGELEKRARQF